MQNPLDTPTKLTNTTNTTSAITNNRSSTLASTSNFDIAQNVVQQRASNSSCSNISSSASYLPQYQAASSPPTITESYYTTQSLTTPLKGIIPQLQHEESKGIPIPGRAQSHEDIRMLGAAGSSYGSPTSSYGLSPNSPRGQYMYGSSPNNTVGGGGFNASPPIRSQYGSYASTTAISGSGGNSSGMGNNMTARRAISRAASPLSNSVPSNINTTGIMASRASPSTSNSRYIAVSKNCSRSDQNVPFFICQNQAYATTFKHTHASTHKHHNHHILLLQLRIQYSKFDLFVFIHCDCCARKPCDCYFSTSSFSFCKQTLFMPLYVSCVRSVYMYVLIKLLYCFDLNRLLLFSFFKFRTVDRICYAKRI